MKKTLPILFLSSIFTTQCFAAPEWKLPFQDGETWTMTRGYNQGSHKNYNHDTSDDRYALDFAYPGGCGSSYGKNAVAVAPGTVMSAKESGSYGNSVLINHGNGYVSRYAHLAEIFVVSNEVVRYGTVIGLVGNTGNIESSCLGAYAGSHIHFAIYKDGVAYKPEPMDGYHGFIVGRTYLSSNVPISDNNCEDNQFTSHLLFYNQKRKEICHETISVD